MNARMAVLAERLERWLEPGGSLARSRVFAVVALGYVLFAATYVPINHASVGRAAHTLYIPGESQLPFVPELVFVYSLTYLLPWLIVATVRDPRTCSRTALAFGLILGISYTTYALFPVTLARPTFVVDSPATWLLAIEYLDPSYNHFPSLHVSLSWLVFLAVRESRSRLTPWVALLVASISLSTLFVKQHYLLDVVYGLGLAHVGWHLAGRVRRIAPRGARARACLPSASGPFPGVQRTGGRSDA